VPAQTTRNQLWLRDFATIFAHAWYRDFPIQPPVRIKAQRADWTIHIGVAVRATADLLGLFSHFESGGRTDAILRDRTKAPVAAFEWEWIRLGKKTNELEKLKRASRDPKFACIQFAAFITYSRESEAEENLARVLKSWEGAAVPLLLTAIVFQWKDKRRVFKRMTFHEVHDGAAQLLRDQPAYPWEVKGSRWEQEQLVK
jgi:hypothetical protein